MFKKDTNGIWNETDKIVAKDRNNDDEYGYFVSIHKHSIIVGSWKDDEDENGNNYLKDAGSAYIYQNCTESDSSIKRSACESYTFNGIKFTKSGKFYDTLVNSTGCDSIVTLDLTIQKDSINIYATGCDSFIWSGDTYYKSGSYKKQFINRFKCDSSVVLSLTINKNKVFNLKASECKQYILNKKTYFKTGIYKKKHTFAILIMAMKIKQSLINLIGIFPKGNFILGLYFISKSHLKKEGWNKSFNKKLPVDAKGKALPWFTYCSIHFLKERLNSTQKVFEYGSGNSTKWFCKQVGEITSVEHDLKWYNFMKDDFSNISNINFKFKELENGDYENYILEFDQEFDIIILDGRKRVECSKNVINALNKNGVIIWDNSDREEYSEGYEFLFEHGFKRLDFSGMGPINHHSWCTSIFYKSDNCLGL